MRWWKSPVPNRNISTIQVREATADFYVNNAAPDIANTIDEAVDWAKKNGATSVYVVRPGAICALKATIQISAAAPIDPGLS